MNNAVKCNNFYCDRTSNKQRAWRSHVLASSSVGERALAHIQCVLYRRQRYLHCGIRPVSRQRLWVPGARRQLAVRRQEVAVGVDQARPRGRRRIRPS